MKLFPVVGLALVLALAHTAAQTTNHWNVTGSGFWTNAASWSLGVAPSTNAQSVIAITNATTKTATIHAQAAAANLTISNLVLSAPGNVTNVLSLENAATPLRVLNSLTITSGGAL